MDNSQKPHNQKIMPGGLQTFQLDRGHTKIGKPAQDRHMYKTESVLVTKGVRFIEV